MLCIQAHLQEIDASLAGHGQDFLGSVNAFFVEETVLYTKGGPKAKAKDGCDDSRVAKSTIIHVFVGLFAYVSSDGKTRNGNRNDAFGQDKL